MDNDERTTNNKNDKNVTKDTTNKLSRKLSLKYTIPLISIFVCFYFITTKLNYKLIGGVLASICQLIDIWLGDSSVFFSLKPEYQPNTVIYLL